MKEIKLEPVTSSNVEAIGYDSETKTARVRFKGGGTYRYEGVSPELFESVRTSPSIGKAVHATLKKCPTSKEGPDVDVPKTWHKSVTLDRVVEACERRSQSLDNPGICIACGTDVEGVEPDAEMYKCESCGEEAVFGVEELLLRMHP